MKLSNLILLSIPVMAGVWCLGLIMDHTLNTMVLAVLAYPVTIYILTRTGHLPSATRKGSSR